MNVSWSRYFCAFTLAAAALVAQTSTSPVLTVAGLSAEAPVATDQILGGGLPPLPDDLLNSIQSGSLELRQQVLFDTTKSTLRVTLLLVPAGTALPTPDGQPGATPFFALTANTTQVSATMNQLSITGTITSQQYSSLFGELTGELVTVTAGYSTSSDGTAVFSGLSATLPGAGVFYSQAGGGRVRITGQTGASLPLAVAGPKGQSFTVPQFSLSGSRSSDPQGGMLTYKWALIAQPGQSVTLTNDSTATPTITITDGPFAYGTYTFQLTVTNSAGLSSIDTVSVDYLSPQ